MEEFFARSSSAPEPAPARLGVRHEHLRFSVLDIFAEPYAAAPQLTARLRIQETHRTAGPRDRLPLPGADRAPAPTLRRGRAVRTARAVRGPATGGSTPSAVPVDAVRHHGAGLHRVTEVDLSCPAAMTSTSSARATFTRVGDGMVPLVLLFSGTVFTRGTTGSAWSRCPGTARPLRAPGLGLAADDLVLLPEYGLDSARPRRARRARRLQRPARPHLVGGDRADPAGRGRRGGVMSADAPASTATGPRSRTPCSTRGICFIPTAPARRKNQSRWQFGVLGPPPASADSFGEAPDMAMECLLAPDEPAGRPSPVHLRFLQLQAREPSGSTLTGPTSVSTSCPSTATGAQLGRGGRARDRRFPRQDLARARVDDRRRGRRRRDVEPLADAAGTPAGRIVRRRWPLVAAGPHRMPTVDGGFVRLARLCGRTTHPDPPDKEAAIRTSLIGAHVLVQAHGARFLSLLDPPEAALAAASRCQQRPVLAGARRLAGSERRRPGCPDHPLRLPRGGRAERGCPLRLDRDRRDPHPAGHDHDRRRKGAGPRDRPACRRIIDRCDEMSGWTCSSSTASLRDPRELDTAPGGRIRRSARSGRSAQVGR